MTEGGPKSSLAANLQEQMISSILSSLIPATDVAPATRRRSKDDPPALNIATLTTNFRKFSGRVGIIFKTQNNIAAILRWKSPRATIGYGMLWTLLCSQPYLVIALPFLIAVFRLLVPSFMHLHPPPPSNIPMPPSLDSWATSTGDAKKFGKTAEGRDFLLNMRDIQNSMDDFTNMYDKIARQVNTYVNFADEKKSTYSLMICMLGSITVIVAARFIPVRFMAFVLGWLVLALGHPDFASLLRNVAKATRSRREKVTQTVATTANKEYIDPELIPETRYVVLYEYRSGSDAPFYSGFSTIGNAGSEDEYVTRDLDTVLIPPGFAYVPDSKWTVVETNTGYGQGLSRSTLRRKVIRKL